MHDDEQQALEPIVIQLDSAEDIFDHVMKVLMFEIFDYSRVAVEGLQEQGVKPELILVVADSLEGAAEWIREQVAAIRPFDWNQSVSAVVSPRIARLLGNPRHHSTGEYVIPPVTTVQQLRDLEIDPYRLLMVHALGRVALKEILEAQSSLKAKAAREVNERQG